MSLRVAFSRNNELCLNGRVIRQSIHPVAGGGFADVWEGAFENRKVAIKVMRPFSSTGRRCQQNKLYRRFWREYLTWSCLCHPNILECLGFSYDFSPDSYLLPSLISPWMANGTITAYLENYPDADCLKILLGVAEGLAYLHSRTPTVVHGDLRGGNILVSELGVPCLSDFGLSRVLSEAKGMTTSTEIAGSLRWMSPELFKADSGVSIHSDIWAFGMTVLEILSGERPYSNVRSDIFVLGHIRDGQVPARPQDGKALKRLSDEIWIVCQRCWTLQPTQRPSMREVKSMLLASGGVHRPLTPKECAITKINKENLHPDPPQDIFASNQVINNPELRRHVMLPSFKWKDPLPIQLYLPPFDSSRPPVQAQPQDQKQNQMIVPKKKVGWSVIYSDSPNRRITDINLVHKLEHESVVRCVRFSPDGQYIATGCNRTAQVYCVRSGAKICVLVDPTIPPGDSYIHSVSFSRDGKYLATGAEDKKIRIWDITRQCIWTTFEGHQKEIYSLEWSNDDSMIVSGSGDKTARIWDMETGEHKALRIDETPDVDTSILSVSISSDGRLVATGSVDMTVRVWDVQTGVLIERLMGHRHAVYSVAFTPDGKGLVSGSFDQTLKHWDLGPLLQHPARAWPLRQPYQAPLGQKQESEKGCQCTVDFTGNKDEVSSLAVSKNSQWIVSGSRDGCVQFWDLQTAQSQLMLQAHKSPVNSLDLSPTGSMLATGSGAWHVRLWKYTTNQ